jgi:hypothetical protein
LPARKEKRGKKLATETRFKFLFREKHTGILVLFG